MKKNLELTYNNNNENKLVLSKKNYITMIVPIILVLLLIVILIVCVKIFNSPSKKINKYLDEIGYICNKETCTKEDNNNLYTVNYSNVTLLVENEIYRLTISQNSPILEIKKDEYICNYTKGDYKMFTLVDDTFIYDKKCEKYINEINESIGKYKEIVNSSGADVNKIEK